MVMLNFICNVPVDLFGAGAIEKFIMKIYVSSGIQPHTTPVRDRKFSALDRSGLMLIGGLISYRITGYKLIKLLRDNTCQIDYGFMCMGTECQT